MLLIDEAMRVKLASAVGPVEVVGPDGVRLGFFTPTPAGPPVTYNLDPGITDEELDRRFNDTTSPTYTTAEVLAHLRTL
jgi:hypothetical protein